MDTLKPSHNAVELACFYTWMGEDGICRTVTKPGADIGLSAAMENSHAVNSFYKTKKFPLLIDARNIQAMSKEARKHFSTNGRETKINCFGIVVTSPLSRVIGNFFMGINKPQVPARLFNNEQDAIAWLKEYL